jgi:hypothetical protein
MNELVKLKGIRNRWRHGRSWYLDPQSSSPSSILTLTLESISILNPRSSGKQYWRSLEELAKQTSFKNSSIANSLSRQVNGVIQSAAAGSSN